MKATYGLWVTQADRRNRPILADCPDEPALTSAYATLVDRWSFRETCETDGVRGPRPWPASNCDANYADGASHLNDVTAIRKRKRPCVLEAWPSVGEDIYDSTGTRRLRLRTE